MSDHADAVALVRAHLADPTSSFSIGSFGAIGEFHRRRDERIVLEDLDRLTLATERGAIRVALHAATKPVAYENLSARERRWQHGVTFCLPQADGRSACRTSLTELGPDREAILEGDRDAILFDMGLHARNIDFCVRTKDPELLAVLRAAEGRSLLDRGGAAMAAIKDAAIKDAAIKDGGPHRVARSALGRIEVYQAIGRTKTPEGPHTHVLPKLIAHGRTHSANTPVPEGLIPCLSLYPSNPLYDQLGNPKPFVDHEFGRFQALLCRWALPEYLAEKQRVERALASGQAPEGFIPPDTRLGRSAVRIAVRQGTWTRAEDELSWAWWSALDAAAGRPHDQVVPEARSGDA